MTLRGALAVSVAILMLFATFPLSSATEHTEGMPPILPGDFEFVPPFQDISRATDEVSFRIHLVSWMEYTGDYTVSLTIDEETIAIIEGFWEPGQEEKNVTTDEDADEGPGVWEPSLGFHRLNITTEAGGESFSIPFNLPMGPDLRPTDLEMSPSDPSPGEQVTFNVTVTNKGTWDTPAGASVPVSLAVGGDALSQESVTSLASGEETTLTFGPWTAQSGTHGIAATVDPDAIEEVYDDVDAQTREEYGIPSDLNELHDEVTIQPDGLAATHLAAAPNPAAPDEAVTVEATVVNEDDQEAPSTPIALYQEGERMGQEETPSLGPGEETKIEWTVQASTGLHQLKAVLDPGDEDTLPEDARGPTYTLLVGPDLNIVDLQPPSEAIEGQPFTVDAIIQNLGTATSREIPVVLFEKNADREDPLNGTTIDGLGQDQIASIQLNSTLEAGNHTLSVRVDPVDDVPEATHEGNQVETTITVKPDAPAPTITTLTPSHAEPKPGDESTLEATVVNQGTQPATNLHARFLVNGTPLGAPLPLGDLGPSDETTVTSPAWTASPGTHEVQLRIGTPDQLESSQPADTGTLTVDIEEPAAALALSGLASQPAEPQRGDQAILTVTVTNDGDTTARDLAVRFATEQGTLSTETVPELGSGDSTTVESSPWTVEDEFTNVTATLVQNDTQANGTQAQASVHAAEPSQAPFPVSVVVAAFSLAAAGFRLRSRV